MQNLEFQFEFFVKKWHFYGFLTSLFIWCIFIHHVKYLDKPIKCLEMREI